MDPEAWKRFVNDWRAVVMDKWILRPGPLLMNPQMAGLLSRWPQYMAPQMTGLIRGWPQHMAYLDDFQAVLPASEKRPAFTAPLRLALLPSSEALQQALGPPVCDTRLPLRGDILLRQALAREEALEAYRQMGE